MRPPLATLTLMSLTSIAAAAGAVSDAPSPILTMTFRSSRGELSFFETITTFSTPRNVTLDEMRIDCAFPADDHTAAVCADLAAEARAANGH